MTSTPTQDDREGCNPGRDPTTTSYASTSQGTSTDPRSTQGDTDTESYSDTAKRREARGIKRQRSPDPSHVAGSGVADREGRDTKRPRRSRKTSDIQGPEANTDTTGDTNSEFQNPTSSLSSLSSSDGNSRTTSTDAGSTQGDPDMESNSDSANPKEARGTKRQRSPEPCRVARPGVCNYEGGGTKR